MMLTATKSVYVFIAERTPMGQKSYELKRYITWFLVNFYVEMQHEVQKLTLKRDINMFSLGLSNGMQIIQMTWL